MCALALTARPTIAPPTSPYDRIDSLSIPKRGFIPSIGWGQLKESYCGCGEKTRHIRAGDGVFALICSDPECTVEVSFIRIIELSDAGY